MPPFTIESFFTICVAILVICLFIRCVASLFRNEPPPTPYYHLPESYNYNRRYEYTEESPKQVIALDTESVSGPGGRSMVARVSLVRRDRKVWDRYVKPLFPVIDYRTPYSGIRERDLVNAEDYSTVRRVAAIIEDCILVGHDLKHDLNGLNLTHPAEDIRDTSEYGPFRKIVADNEAKDIVKTERMKKLTSMGHYDALEMTLCHVQAMSKAEQVRQRIISTKPKLSLLAHLVLGRRIQTGEHSSVEDARTALDLYLLVEGAWEAAVAYE